MFKFAKTLQLSTLYHVVRCITTHGSLASAVTTHRKGRAHRVVIENTLGIDGAQSLLHLRTTRLCKQQKIAEKLL